MEQDFGIEDGSALRGAYDLFFYSDISTIM